MILDNDISKFLIDGDLSSDEGFFYCRTRDQSASRYSKWFKSFISTGISESNASIITAIIGELTNNSFDHNLGKWKEPSGCAVKIIKEKAHLVIYIADRGQGIISSLASTVGTNFTNQQILVKAFEERISGRSPEKRGNGLKFVINNVHNSNHSLFCYSQDEEYTFGEYFGSIEVPSLPKNFGTLICFNWSLK